MQGRKDRHKRNAAQKRIPANKRKAAPNRCNRTCKGCKSSGFPLTLLALRHQQQTVETRPVKRVAVNRFSASRTSVAKWCGIRCHSRGPAIGAGSRSRGLASVFLWRSSGIGTGEPMPSPVAPRDIHTFEVDGLLTLVALRHQRRHAEIASALLHQFFEATPCPVPKLGLEGNVARSQGATFVLARSFAAAPLAATIIVHLAGMVAGRGTHTHSRALVSTIRASSAARIDAPADVRIG